MEATSATSDSKPATRRRSSANRRAPKQDRRMAGLSMTSLLQRPEVKSQMKRMGITNDSHTGRLINAVSGEIGNVDTIISAMGGLGNMRETAANAGASGGTKTLGAAHSDILKRLDKLNPNLIQRVGQRIMGEMSSGRTSNEELMKEITAMSESDEFKNTIEGTAMGGMNPSVLFKSALGMTQWLRAEGISIVFAPLVNIDAQSLETSDSWQVTFAQFAPAEGGDAKAAPERNIAWMPMMSPLNDGDPTGKVDVKAHIMDVVLVPCIVSKFTANADNTELMDADTRAMVADAMLMPEVGGRSGRHSSEVLLPSAQSVFFVGSGKTGRPVAVVPCTKSSVPRAIELAVAATRAFRELPNTVTCMVRIHDEGVMPECKEFTDLPELGPMRATHDALTSIDSHECVVVFK